MNLQTKKNMNSNEMVLLESEMNKVRKSKTPMWLLWVFTGGIGGHRYYLGDIGYAVAMTFCNWATLGVWGLVDAFLINQRLEQKNEQAELEIISQIKAGQ